MVVLSPKCFLTYAREPSRPCSSPLHSTRRIVRRGCRFSVFSMRTASIITTAPVPLSVVPVAACQLSICAPSITISFFNSGSSPGISATTLFSVESTARNVVFVSASIFTSLPASSNLTRRLMCSPFISSSGRVGFASHAREPPFDVNTVPVLPRPPLSTTMAPSFIRKLSICFLVTVGIGRLGVFAPGSSTCGSMAIFSRSSSLRRLASAAKASFISAVGFSTTILSFSLPMYLAMSSGFSIFTSTAAAFTSPLVPGVHALGTAISCW